MHEHAGRTTRRARPRRSATPSSVLPAMSHRTRRPLRAAAALLLLPLLLAADRCPVDEPASPLAPPSGTYVLRTIDGQPVPRAVYSFRDFTNHDFDYVVVAETLAFEQPGVARRTRVTMETEQGTGTVSARHGWSVTESYRLDGTVFRFVYPPCPPNADCIAPDWGVFDGEALVLFANWLPHDAHEQGPRLVYRRTDD